MAAAPAAVAEPMDPVAYKIEGDNLEIVRVTLKPGQEVYAEAGKMVYKTANVEWKTQMSGSGIGEKLFGALKRKLTGESLFMTHFKSTGGDGEVGFAGDFPGRVQAFELAAGQSVLVQRDGFILAERTVSLDIAFTKKIGAGLFGGEGIGGMARVGWRRGERAGAVISFRSDRRGRQRWWRRRPVFPLVWGNQAAAKLTA